MNQKLRVIDLFCGIGTAEQALKELGIPFEVVACCEIDRFANESRAALHGADNNLGDIKAVTELPECDLLMFSAPCQAISLAGKQAGITEGSGTSSSLLWEVKRLLYTARDNGTLPKYLVMENVKNLVGQRFKPEFDKWLGVLSDLGYTNYWQVLNAKDYAIPQHRQRVFCVSILGEHAPYKFPAPFPLRLRLKDMLDTEVDERFYLSERALKSLGHSPFNQEKNRLQDADGVHRTCCSRDFKSPTCVKVGDLVGGKWDKSQEHMRRVYSSEGLSPCVHTAQSGNSHLKIVDDLYKGREAREYTDCSPTIRGKSYDLKVVAGQIQPVNRDYRADGEPRKEHFEARRDEIANAVLTGDRKNMVQIAALRGRLDDEGEYVQRLEIGAGDTTHTLTNVAKDNLVIEPQVLKTQRTEYGKAVRKAYESHEIPGDRHAMREQVPRTDGVANTLTLQQRDNILMEAPYITPDDADASKCVRAGGHGLHYGHTWDVIRIREATKKGYAEAGEGDGVNIQYPNSTTARARVGKGISNTLMCGEGRGVVTGDYRIRKLSPWECLRLMGWRDKEIRRIREAGISNAQQYRQAGNGIVVTVLIAIFGELFGVPYREILESWDWREDGNA